MNFEKHLFISYAHIDNKSLTPEEQGWITQFHSSLESFLSMRIGGEARIWRANKLQGNDVFGDEILDQFPKTALLVSVVSPRYLKSEWCAREVNAFCDSAQQTGGVVVDNKARIFKVIKAPVSSQDSLPSVMKDTLGYEFYKYEEEAPLELDPKENAQDYRRKVNKLAWDIAQLLEKLDAGSDEDNQSFEEQAHAETKPPVYLAECSYDRKQDREILEGELRHHGYKVFPDQQLPREELEYVAAVKSLLERCVLSIHLVGDTYGGVPDGPTQKSVAVLQNELAAERSKACAFPRVIWLPEETRSDQAQQQAFIETLHQDAEAQFGADLITGDIEELKTSVYSALKKLEKPEPQEPAEQSAAADSAKLIYLICDEKDRKATIPVRKFCKQQGFEVAIPPFEGDATAVREAHRQLMTNCDAVILYYGAGNEAWKRTLDNELKKMPGYRGGKPLLASHTYLAAPKTADKEDLIDMEEPNLIHGLDDFSETEMAAFVQAVNPNGATP
jgi:hypothetical protein